MRCPSNSAASAAGASTSREAETKSTEAEIAQLVATTRNAVRRAYFDRVVADARVALLDDLQTIVTRARDAARQRFEAGSSPRLEVLQAELELAQAQNEAIGAHGASSAARARFNALLGLPTGAETSIVEADLEAVPTADAAIARARAASAELALFDRRLEAQRARIALAKAMQKPDITPEGSYTHGWESGAEFQNGWKAALAITLPIFTTHKAGVALEESTLAQLTAERNATDVRIAAEVTAAVAVAEAQRQQVTRYRDEILPQAVRGRDAWRTMRIGSDRRASPPTFRRCRPRATCGCDRCRPKPTCRRRWRISNRRLERPYNHEALQCWCCCRRRLAAAGCSHDSRRRSRERNDRPGHDRRRDHRVGARLRLPSPAW